MKFCEMSKHIGMNAGYVLEGTISLNTGYHFRFILGAQLCMKWSQTNEQMEK